MNNKQTDNLHILKLSQVEIPSHKNVYTSSDEWVKWGENNLYPLYLIDLFSRSSLHHSIISSKVDYIVGEGFSYNENKDQHTDDVLLYANKNETWNDILKKAAFDYVLFNGFALEVRRGKWKKDIVSIHNIDFHTVRSGKRIGTEIDELIEKYYICEDWKRYRSYGNSVRSISAYRKDSLEEVQLIYFFNRTPGADYYPKPDYEGGLAAIETASEIANFQLSVIKNGMFPGLLINFFEGTLTEEEQRNKVDQIQRKFVGSDPANKIVVSFNNNKETAPSIDPIQSNDNENKFKDIYENIKNEILYSHRVTSPMLVGDKTAGQLGGSTEILTAWQLFYNNVIKSAKQDILNVFNKLGKEFGIKELTINTPQPISYVLSENVIKEVLTKNEMRKLMGFDPIDESSINENNI